MMLTETKILQVANETSIINETNNEWGSFGWCVFNIQITHTQDSRTYTKGLDFFTGDSTVETTTINYASITYQRDKMIENYSQIVQLEQQYIALKEEMNEKLERTIDRDTKIDWFAINPIKQIKATKNIVKRMVGMNSPSRKANAECEAIFKSYQAQLQNLRMQAETLLR